MQGHPSLKYFNCSSALMAVLVGKFHKYCDKTVYCDTYIATPHENLTPTKTLTQHTLLRYYNTILLHCTALLLHCTTGQLHCAAVLLHCTEACHDNYICLMIYCPGNNCNKQYYSHFETILCVLYNDIIIA